MRLIVSLAAATLLATTAGGAFAASAVQKECSTKYQAAKSAGTLNGMTYNQYYSQCAKEERAEKAGGTATPTATAAPATAPAAASAPKAPTATAARPRRRRSLRPLRRRLPVALFFRQPSRPNSRR